MVKMYLITQCVCLGFSLLFYKLHIIWIFVMDRCCSLNFKSMACLIVI